MSDTTVLPPLVKSVTVAAPPERAFDLFTTEMGQWWPLVTHSVGKDSATSVTMECRVGGRIVETEREATLVTVTFRPHGGQTEVQLVHTGWDVRPDGAQARTGYDIGWDIVLGNLTSLAVSDQS